MIAEFPIAGLERPLFPIAFGCMRLGGKWTHSPLTTNAITVAKAAVHAALEQGINCFDHADIYARGKAEETFAAIFAESPKLRERVILQSKCGVHLPDEKFPNCPPHYDLSRTHIIRAVEASLRRLGTDYLDLLLLHHPDPLVEPDAVAAAFDALYDAGKVRAFGVSNHTAAQIALLQRSVRQPIVVNQLQFSLLHTELIDSGIVDTAIRRHHSPFAGTLEYCRAEQIRVQAWSPLARGILAGTRPGRHDSQSRIDAVRQELTAIAAERGVAESAVALAWVLRHPAGIMPVIGTHRTERIADACAAVSVKLTRPEWYRLFVAGRGQNLP